jgi:methylated-DNA-protein-cysteine methyltransferase related protein
MPKSPAFIRIKADALKMVAAIPARKCCSFRSIGEHLDVVPRHVAYILSQLSDEEKNSYPWYRVVADDGQLGAAKFHADGRPQAECLRDEGLLISDNTVMQFEKYFVPAAQLKSGVAKQRQPEAGNKTTERKK